VNEGIDLRRQTAFRFAADDIPDEVKKLFENTIEQSNFDLDSSPTVH